MDKETRKSLHEAETAETKQFTVRNTSPGNRWVHTKDGTKLIAAGGTLTAEFTKAEYESMLQRAELIVDGSKGGERIASMDKGDAEFKAALANPATPVEQAPLDFDKATKAELRAYLDAAGVEAPSDAAKDDLLKLAQDHASKGKGG